MLVVNFSHPLTAEQKGQLEAQCGPFDVQAVKCQFDISALFAPQVVAFADQVGLSPDDWQAERLMVLLPALAPAAALMLVELHGRCGYYPPVVRLTQRQGAVPPVFDVAEVMDLNSQRQAARERR